jgi:hypothetical protein
VREVERMARSARRLLLDQLNQDRHDSSQKQLNGVALHDLRTLCFQAVGIFVYQMMDIVKVLGSMARSFMKMNIIDCCFSHGCH